MEKEYKGCNPAWSKQSRQELLLNFTMRKKLYYGESSCKEVSIRGRLNKIFSMRWKLAYRQRKFYHEKELLLGKRGLL